MATGRSNKQTHAKDAGKNPKNWQIPKKRYNIDTNLKELHQMRFKRKEFPENDNPHTTCAQNQLQVGGHNSYGLQYS